MTIPAIRLVSAVVLVFATAAALPRAASVEFLSTWKAPDARPLHFGGRKVAGVLITDDDSLRVSTEEALAREIGARGSVAIPAYRIIPREEVRNSEAAKGWFSRAGVQGLVVLRIVKTETQKVYSSAIWSSGYYGSAWDYWGYGWANVVPIGKGRNQRTITVETLLYDLAEGKPIWAGISQATDPKNVQAYMKELATEVVKRLQKDGLVKKS